jgi:protein O-mannosyl-transferase
MAAALVGKRWLLRPSLWTCILGIVAYWDSTALHGGYVYDDAGSIKNNPVVTGAVSWKEAATRDFWGTPMTQPQSHKSFRPLTTLSFRLNWMWSEWRGTSDTEDHTYGFHVVNVALHGFVTALVTEAAAFVLEGETTVVPQLLTGLLWLASNSR